MERKTPLEVKRVPPWVRTRRKSLRLSRGKCVRVFVFVWVCASWTCATAAARGCKWSWNAHSMYVVALLALTKVYLPAHINVKSLSTPARTLAASRCLELVRLAAGLCAHRKSVDAQAIDQPELLALQHPLPNLQRLQPFPFRCTPLGAICSTRWWFYGVDRLITLMGSLGIHSGLGSVWVHWWSDSPWVLGSNSTGQ